MESGSGRPIAMFLNGVSSSGKTSIAKKLIEELHVLGNQNWELVCMDEVCKTLEQPTAEKEEQLSEVDRAIRSHIEEYSADDDLLEEVEKFGLKEEDSELQRLQFKRDKLYKEIMRLSRTLKKGSAQLALDMVKKKIERGVSVVCDIVIQDKKDFIAIDELRRIGSVYLTLVYCPMEIVLERVCARNATARESGDSENVRDLQQILHGFRELYSFSMTDTFGANMSVNVKHLLDLLDQFDCCKRIMDRCFFDMGSGTYYDSEITEVLFLAPNYEHNIILHNYGSISGDLGEVRI